MKAIYVFSTNNKDYKADGEAKKVFSQINAFKDAGVEIHLLDVVLGKKTDKILYRLPFCGVYPEEFIRKCSGEAAKADFVYIRKNIFDGSYYDLLLALKKSNPKIKVFVEIPTYPYFQEWNRLVDRPFIWKEKHALQRIRKNHLVDYYITLTDDKQIYGAPAIQFDNCISIDDYKPRRNKQLPNEVHLVGVALLAFWHGYDRVIKGMQQYYSGKTHETKVVFHIVGDGPEYGNFKRMIEQSGLEDYVILEGRQKGDALDHFYDIANVGVGTLGLFRKGLSNANSIKLREYCAKGLPFIKAAGDKAFDDYEYCLSFPNDDTPIDIQRIVDWTKNIDYEKAAVSMREYALQNLCWGKYINEIIMRVNETENN